jgi:hypothetical protein
MLPEVREPEKAAMVTQFFCATRTRMIYLSASNYVDWMK